MKLIDETLLDEFRCKRKCELCRKKVGGCDPCHLLSRGAGRVDIRENLIACCRKCHQAMHNDPNTLMLAFLAVAIRERTSVDQIKEKVWAVRRLPKT